MVLFRDQTVVKIKRSEILAVQIEKKDHLIEEMKILLEERNKPKSFTTEEASQFQRYRYIFYVSDMR